MHHVVVASRHRTQYVASMHASRYGIHLQYSGKESRHTPRYLYNRITIYFAAARPSAGPARALADRRGGRVGAWGSNAARRPRRAAPREKR